MLSVESEDLPAPSSERPRQESHAHQATQATAHAPQTSSVALDEPQLQVAVRDLIELAPDAMVLSNAAGEIALVNQQTEALFGYTRHDLFGKPIEVLLPERLRDLHVQHRHQFSTQPAHRPMDSGQEFFGRRQDDSEFPIEISLSPLATTAGAFILSTIRDISERKHLEAAARERASQIEGIFETAADGIALYDDHGYIVCANQAMKDLARLEHNPAYLAQSPEERTNLLQLREPATARLLSVEERPVMRALRGEMLAGATAVDVHMRALDGREVAVSMSAAPLRDESGRISGAVVVMRDVTERRRAEAERTHIMSLVSHELKTPLNVLRMGGGLIRRYAERDQAPEMELLLRTAGLLESGVSLMERLVNDLIDAARMETGHAVLNLEPTDVAALARRVAQEQMDLSGRPVIVKAPKRSLMATVDAMRIAQVLTNLLSNAFRYSPPNTSARLRLHRTHAHARFEVRDDGPGIPADLQQRLFERFFRAPGIEVQQGSGVGLGLGLYICRGLVELHHGRIGVQSEEGHGATFWFTLPLALTSA